MRYLEYRASIVNNNKNYFNMPWWTLILLKILFWCTIPYKICHNCIRSHRIFLPQAKCIMKYSSITLYGEFYLFQHNRTKNNRMRPSNFFFNFLKMFHVTTLSANTSHEFLTRTMVCHQIKVHKTQFLNCIEQRPA